MAKALSLTPTSTPQSFPNGHSDTVSSSSHTEGQDCQNLLYQATSQRQDLLWQRGHLDSNNSGHDHKHSSARSSKAKRTNQDAAHGQLGKQPAKFPSTSITSFGPPSSVRQCDRLRAHAEDLLPNASRSQLDTCSHRESPQSYFSG